MVQKVPGIMIKYRTGKAKGTGRPYLLAEFFIREGTRSKTFISNREIRERINASKMIGKKLGWMKLSIYDNGKEALWSDYCPFSKSPKAEAAFSGRGIAEHLEYFVKKELKNVFPTVKYTSSIGSREARIEQLRKRGAKIRKVGESFWAWHEVR